MCKNRFFISRVEMSLSLSLIFSVIVIVSESKSSDLPKKHFSIYQSQNFDVKSASGEDSSTLPRCYGYEENCEDFERYDPTSPHSCSKKESDIFWNQGDFGYIKNMRNTLFPVCEGGTTSLFCTSRFQFCKAQNLYLNLVEQQPRNWPRHPTDLFEKNEIGGSCDVDDDVIAKESSHSLSGGVRDWHSELRSFSSINNFVMNESYCDLIIDKPIVFMKWDQGENLYHRLCDFLNLYLSQLVNGSTDFNKDFYIVNWDWTQRKYIDYFHQSISAFTKHPVIDIKTWFGKKVCIPSATFSLLPRMILGIFYNTPLGHNCFGSSLMKSFVDLFLHRLKIPQSTRPLNETRVTFLVRSHYQNPNRVMFRKIVNQNQLTTVMQNISGVKVQVVDFQANDVTFLEQINLIQNTDILVSIHGAGLTHLLFLPDWAVVFEIFDCEAKCYRDLSRLRGVQHVTWKDQSKFEKHMVKEDIEKTNLRYYNYSFDRDEFERLFLQAKNLLERNSNEITHTEL